MKKKITFIFEIGLTCIVALFAFYGLLCFIKTIGERSEDRNRTEEIAYTMNYSRYDINHDMIHSLLVISGNGTVSKEVVDAFEAVDMILVCKSVSGIEPHAFRDVEELKVLVMSADIDFADNDLPMYTDMYYIEDCFYEFLETYA